MKGKNSVAKHMGSKPSDVVEHDYILVDTDIRELVGKSEVMKNGNIDRIQAAKYDCVADFPFQVPEQPQAGNDGRPPDQPAKLVIEKGTMIRLRTREFFEVPLDFVLHVSPKAGLIQKGILAYISTLVDPGFVGPFEFPIHNISNDPIEIHAGDPILSVEFVRLGRRASIGYAARKRSQGEAR